MKLRKTLAGILGAVVMLLGVGTFEHVNRETGVNAANEEWVLVKDVSNLAKGDKVVIAAKDSDYAMSTTQNGNNRAQAAATKTGDKLRISSSVEVFTLEDGKTSGTFSFKDEDNGGKPGYLYAASSRKNYLKTEATLSNNSSWTIEINSSTGVATIKAQGSNSRNWMRYNSTNNPPIFSAYSSGQNNICIYERVEGQGTTCECSNFVEEKEPQDINNYKSATCTEPAKYFLVCSVCGNKSDDITKVYSYGDPAGHKPDELGKCTVCGEYGDLTLEQRVQKLFNKYFNEGSYTKETILNVNPTAMKEVGTYFHAEAIAPYRKTVYEPGKLSMVTSNVKGEYDNDTLSVYENNSDKGNVKHTGLGGNWEVNWPSVEYKFVTLKDFKESTITGWTYENGIYSFNLAETTATFEDNMTRMAREFVAPMWLAPNADNYSYVSFTKLTVEEDGAELVMKLFVNKDNVGKLIDQSECLFSQARISKGTTNLATFELGENGGTSESSDAKDTYTETVNGYTLSLTGGSKMYPYSHDKKENGTIKMGSSSAIGQFTFEVPKDVNKVVINVAGRTKTIKIDINGKQHSISTLAENGEYTPIEIDTSSTKTITFKTVETSDEYRCVINSIEYHAK